MTGPNWWKVAVLYVAAPVGLVWLAVSGVLGSQRDTEFIVPAPVVQSVQVPDLSCSIESSDSGDVVECNTGTPTLGDTTDLFGEILASPEGCVTIGENNVCWKSSFNFDQHTGSAVLAWEVK